MNIVGMLLENEEPREIPKSSASDSLVVPPPRPHFRDRSQAPRYPWLPGSGCHYNRLLRS